MSLKKKIIKGSLWNTLARIGSQLINMGITIILARILNVEDFGLIGNVSIILGAISFFTEFGMTPTLIIQKEVDEVDKNTVFWTAQLFSSILYLIIFFLSPLISMAYNDDRMTWISRILFITFLIQPISYIPMVNEYRILRYNRFAIFDIISMLISGVVGVILALTNFKIWSLIIQNLLSTFIRCFLLYIFSDWRIKFIFSIKRFVLIIKNGINFTINNVFIYLSESVSSFLVGKFLGNESLGLYSFSFRISRYPMTRINEVFSSILFPAFSTINDNKEKIKINYIKISAYILFLISPILVVLYFCINPLIILLVGEKWIGTIPIIKILLFFILFECFSYADEPILKSINKVKLLNIFRFISIILIVIFGYLSMIKFKLIGISFVFSMAYILYYCAIKIVILKNLKMSLLSYLIRLKDVLILFSVILFSTLIIYKLFYKLLNPLLFIIILIFVIVAIYLVFIFLKKIISFKDKKIILDNLID